MLTVIVIAHRGIPDAHRPENSVAAVAAALVSGADGVEVDLRLTSDGVLALSHDRTLTRLTGLPLAIAGTAWPVLQSAARGRGVELARVEQVLVLAAGRRIVLELKRPPSGPAVAVTALALGDALAGLRQAGVAVNVTISSFDPALLRAVRRLVSGGAAVHTALLGEPTDAAAAVLRRALDGEHDQIHPHVASLLRDPAAVVAAHACGLAVVPWTVNRLGDARRLAGLGVDGVITDVPSIIRAWTGRVEQGAPQLASAR